MERFLTSKHGLELFLDLLPSDAVRVRQVTKQTVSSSKTFDGLLAFALTRPRLSGPELALRQWQNVWAQCASASASAYGWYDDSMNAMWATSVSLKTNSKFIGEDDGLGLEPDMDIKGVKDFMDHLLGIMKSRKLARRSCQSSNILALCGADQDYLHGPDYLHGLSTRTFCTDQDVYNDQDVYAVRALLLMSDGTFALTFINVGNGDHGDDGYQGFAHIGIRCKQSIASVMSKYVELEVDPDTDALWLGFTDGASGFNHELFDIRPKHLPLLDYITPKHLPATHPSKLASCSHKKTYPLLDLMTEIRLRELLCTNMPAWVADDTSPTGRDSCIVLKSISHNAPETSSDSPGNAPVTDYVVHDEPAAQQDQTQSLVSQMQADEDWAAVVEHSLHHAPYFESERTEGVFMYRFGSGDGNSFRMRLLTGAWFAPCIAALKKAEYPHVHESGAIIFVSPYQYAEVIQRLSGEELHPFHVVITSSLLYLLDEVRMDMPSQSRPRQKDKSTRTLISGHQNCNAHNGPGAVTSGVCADDPTRHEQNGNRAASYSDVKGHEENDEHEIDVGVVLEKTFVCIAPKPKDANSVAQSTTEAVHSSCPSQPGYPEALVPAQTYYSHYRGKNPRRLAATL